ncbi:MAG: geranylgeranyl reductase family protein [Deltaproteobacteria bacterium]|nr:geranylgeranyl reductase family protein [Deltaproteobacteria bacterium]
MEREHEIAVIGAGPAGAVAALQACRLGLGPVLLLDKAPLGRQKPCGSGLSPRAMKLLADLGLWQHIESRAYPISGLALTSPSGRSASVSGKASAVVLPRAELDRLLVQQAVAAGARFEPGCRVRRIERRAGLLELETDVGPVAARWVVAADGAPARFSRDPSPRRLLLARMGWFEGRGFRPHTLEMIFHPDWAPHYGWLFPESEQSFNIGVCLRAEKLGRRSLRRLFDAFAERCFGERLASARQIGPLRSHPISTAVLVRHRAPPGVLLAGEAARLANPATGEGISYAMESGRLAAEAILRGRQRCMPAEAVAAGYASSLRRAVTPGFAAAELFCRLGMPVLDAITRLGGLAAVRRLSSDFLSRI